LNEPPDRPAGDNPEEELAGAVLDYLEEHPHAMDTFEGIAQWWLAGRKVHVDEASLAHVLDRLAREGVLERIGTGESARYRLKK
jgi:hypothetical protein